MTVICGIFIITSNMTGAYVTGHVVCGLGLITACVSTAATSSTRFSLIPKTQATAVSRSIPRDSRADKARC